MAVTGAIADTAKDQMPLTWDKLLNEERDRFGEDGIQRTVNRVKARLFGSVVDPDDEETTYSSIVVEYAGKMVAIQLCPSAADYWARQPVTRNQGQREVSGFIDPVEAIWELHKRLVADTAELKPIVDPDLSSPTMRRRIAVSEPDDELMRTASPAQFDRSFARTAG